MIQIDLKLQRDLELENVYEGEIVGKVHVQFAGQLRAS